MTFSEGCFCATRTSWRQGLCTVRLVPPWRFHGKATVEGSATGLLHKGEDFFEIGFVVGGAELLFRETAGSFSSAAIRRSFEGVERHAAEG